MQSPLGKYAPVIAALTAVGVIAAAVAARFAGPGADGFLDNLALLAFGAIFGSAATTNGSHAEVKALHKRVDTLYDAGPAAGAGAAAGAVAGAAAGAAAGGVEPGGVNDGGEL